MLPSLEQIGLRVMTDNVAEPLIADRPATPRDEYGHTDDHASAVEAEDDECALVRPGRTIWVLTLCAGISGLLFGYEYFFPTSSKTSRANYVISLNTTIEYVFDMLAVPVLYPRHLSPSTRISLPGPLAHSTGPSSPRLPRSSLCSPPHSQASSLTL